MQILPGASSRLLRNVPVRVQNLVNGLRGRVAPALVVVTVRGTEAALRLCPLNRWTPMSMRAALPPVSIRPRWKFVPDQV